MKWTVKLVAELQPGTLVEQEVITVEREDRLSPATVGLTIAEGKAIMENLQQQIVAAQVQRHGASIKSCSRCGKAFRTKGYYQSTLRSVYGEVRMPVRRLKGCSCTESQERSSANRCHTSIGQSVVGSVGKLVGSLASEIGVLTVQIPAVCCRIPWLDRHSVL